MQRPTDYKQCPKCGQAAALTDPSCVRCGHLYSTHFPPPNQTQAFIGGAPMPPPNQTQAFFPPGGQLPPNQTQAFFPPGGHPSYGYPPQDQFASFLLSIPPAVCFIIGLLANVISIGLIVCYFAYAPARDPRRGWAAAWGMIVSFSIGFVTFGLGMWLDLCNHRH